MIDIAEPKESPLITRIFRIITPTKLIFAFYVGEMEMIEFCKAIRLFSLDIKSRLQARGFGYDKSDERANNCLTHYSISSDAYALVD